MSQDDLTTKQKDYAIFLPAISGFYSAFIGRQRVEDYVDPTRFPQGLNDMEELNWLNSQKSLFPYKWSLYSGGHANLDLNKEVAGENMVRKREAGSVILGDSGGFQIARGLWEGDWKANSGCPKAQAKRDSVLKWLDNVSDYAMTLDIPTWIALNPEACKNAGITFDKKQGYIDAVNATHFNNEYFIKHRKGIDNGGTRILNVLQGGTHSDADEWYEMMKKYCDPKQYPGRHFNGWAMGGQNMCDVHLILKRLITLKYDNLLQEGVHDWMHFLGTSKLEWAVLLTVIQRAVRKYVNPSFTISFDCASPFLSTANGQVYYQNVFPPDGKWSYRMAPAADDKKYATDTRPWTQGVVADGIFPNGFSQSPPIDLCKMKDICIYKPGDLNKIGKEGKTSWDSFSYALLMSHNVYMHITAVQEANRQFDAGVRPGMMTYSAPGQDKFEEIVERIFAAPTKEESIAIIDEYNSYWMEIIGGRGNLGKKAQNHYTMFNKLFEFVDYDDSEEFDEHELEELENGQTGT